jgi:hypothetical protein
MRVLTHKSWLT